MEPNDEKIRDGHRRGLKAAFSYPENLLEDILRARSLTRGLEALGYPDFLRKLFKKALHSKGILG